MAIPSPKQLAAFAASAKTLNFTKAAADLGVQQPAVSRHILGLEQILGVRLFVRTKPKLTLTSRGRALSAVVMASFEAIYAATDKISNPVNSVSVGFSDDIASHYLAPLLSGFQANNPDIALQITERDPSQSTPISHGYHCCCQDQSNAYPYGNSQKNQDREVFPEQVFQLRAP